ncbi:MAG: hypothetical protein COT92_03105 [Candidatus Doudnabacteria bacterium CG10_big_fil_rev_8_21_14_0_10_42_18]|uniref:PKD domain-containing protein n=1 Tax=Candidatus Doudnabacteria bacterium CG10_big_fil_rev_8_21_14_0_10_42_18 TaxID=1974552 RepID=A0A2H0VAE5_9BACT|nr:MAG: hypothetical protein COT92_03105 [Candidatus Doudnabacteria bacterium CG10_big_fil_rev_8_21_14_0_10_42_18]
MFNKVKPLLLTISLVWAAQFTVAQASPHALGSNIITPEGTVYTITKENNQIVKRPYTSPGAFLSFSYNTWDTIVGASADDMSLPVGSFIAPQDGKIVCSDRGNDKGTCYLITNGKKAGFTSANIFTQLGYNFNFVIFGDVSFLPSTENIDTPTAPHNPGSLINKDGTVYLVVNNGLLGLPNWNTLESWGYLPTDIIPANSADRNLSVVGTLVPKQPEQISPTNVEPVAPTNSAPVSSMTATSPEITGSTSAQVGVSNSYFFRSTAKDGSYDGGLITYTVNWGDGTITNSSVGFPSGVSHNASHTWTNAGTYQIYVTATPALGSPASGILSVTVN